MSRTRVKGRALLLTLAALGCSGSQSQRANPPVVTVEVDAGAVAAADAGAANPWEGLDRAALARRVTEGATARLREVQPDFDLAQLDAYIANPESSPAISGRASDELFNLAIVALAEGHPERAEGIVRLVRARARNRNMAYAGTTVLAEAARRRAGEGEAEQRRAVEAVFSDLPRARLGASTVVYQLIQTQAQLDARIGQVHQQMVSPETARAALWYGAVLPEVVRRRDMYLAAVGAVRTANEARPADRPYAFGTVDLARDARAQPVLMAVWDVGTNPELFRQQLFVNAAEQPNGQDDDHNGLVDDISGIASDPDPAQTALLYNPGDEVIQRYAPFLRGVMDLRAGMASSPAAQRVLELQRGITDAAQAEALDNHLAAIGEWAHGTHVAGIMLAGNPRARLAIFRSAWAGEHRVYHDRGPTDAELDAERANMDDIARFINAHHVRVVNASLGFSIEYLEDQLRHERDRYHSPDEVRARARAVQQRRRESWQHVFEACPDTLFVIAAGNSNEDVAEYEEVAAANVAPNLLVVGAVDRFGSWATFTNSNPERVRVFDHGVEVDSLIPNGEHVPLSGTSMASPNVANLAGKMLAVNPALTPPRLIEMIYETGDPIAAPFNGHIANETRAVAAARRAPRASARPAAATPARPATR